MAAQTSDQTREYWSVPERGPNEATVILATEVIYEGALCMLVAGKIRAYVSGTAGSTMLGFSRKHYDASSSDQTLDQNAPAIFSRDIGACPGKAGDLPTQAFIGKAVYFDDSSGTVKLTMATNDLSGILRRIEGGYFWVEPIS